jgi:hypothetical protein
MKMNTLLIEKKQEKSITGKIVNKLCHELNMLRSEMMIETDSIKNKIKVADDNFQKLLSSPFYRIIENKELLDDESKKIQEQIEYYRTKYKNSIKEYNNEIMQLEKRLAEKIAIKNREYDRRKATFNTLENEIKQIKADLSMYVKEQKDYYLSMLMQGYDVRKEGIVWIVKRLIELNTYLDVSMFPKVLDYSQIEYILNLGYTQIEVLQLKIVLKALKRRQNKKNNFSIFSSIDDFLSLQDTLSANEEEEIKKKSIRKAERQFVRNSICYKNTQNFNINQLYDNANDNPHNIKDNIKQKINRKETKNNTNIENNSSININNDLTPKVYVSCGNLKTSSVIDSSKDSHYYNIGNNTKITKLKSKFGNKVTNKGLKLNIEDNITNSKRLEHESGIYYDNKNDHINSIATDTNRNISIIEKPKENLNINENNDSNTKNKINFKSSIIISTNSANKKNNNNSNNNDNNNKQVKKIEESNISNNFSNNVEKIDNNLMLNTYDKFNHYNKLRNDNNINLNNNINIVSLDKSECINHVENANNQKIKILNQKNYSLNNKMINIKSELLMLYDKIEMRNNMIKDKLEDKTEVDEELKVIYIYYLDSIYRGKIKRRF